jgi:hypothetical protein
VQTTGLRIKQLCRGGWVALLALNEFADSLVAGVIPHPSFHWEANHGGNSTELCKKCTKPILLLPGSKSYVVIAIPTANIDECVQGNDSEAYDEGGEMLEALKAGCSESATCRFPTVKHGWVPRGDILDPVVRDAVELAIQKIYEYFSKFM